MTNPAPAQRPSRTQRPSRAERPAPEWDEVYRRNFLERLKRDRPPLEVREELPELVARGYEDISEEEMVRLHWWGAAHDKPKVGTFMVRIKVAGGQVTPAQLRGLGRIVEVHARDEVELTTRQGAQLHWVPMAGLSSVIEEVEALGLTTVGAEGDTVRNITSCPVAGLTRDEAFDVSPVIRQVADFFDGNPAYSNLPRKHKYTISACHAQCNAPEIADVALVGTLKDGRPGFGLRIGGGMANTPRISRDLGVFVPVEDAVAVLRAVTDTWQNDLRNRMSRARARIKFMMDDHGPEGTRALVEATLGRALEAGAAPAPIGDNDHMGVHAQRQPGLVHIGVPVPTGRTSGTVLQDLADVVESVGGDVRFTRQQNVVLGNIPTDEADGVQSRLVALGLPVGRGRAYARSIACTSSRFCNYAVAETKTKLEEVLEHLGSRFGHDSIGELAIHLDGCPHACAQHWIGEIGLQGTTTRLDGSGERSEAYDLSVGGGLGRRTAVGRRLLRRVPTNEVEGVLERLVGAWLDARRSHADPAAYTLGDYCADRTDEELVAVAVGVPPGPDTAPRGVVLRLPGPLQRYVDGADEELVAVAVGVPPGPDTAPRGVVLRLPGPLQRYVDGADELTVSAATVGEALAAVTRRYPGLGETVLPGGLVAGAFLVTVGDDDIRGLDGLGTTVADGDVISVVMAMAGG